MTGKVFLRPDEWHRPVNYIKSVEKSGLMVLPQQNLALMTCKTGPNQGPVGPQGPQGEDRNSWFDTIIASASDEYSPLTIGGPKTNFRAPYPLDLTDGYVRISLTTAPQGAALIVDLHMNDVSLFTTPVQIDDGMLTSVGSIVPAVLATTYVPDDAEFKVYVTQIGSVIAGTGLKVAVTGVKTEAQ